MVAGSHHSPESFFIYIKKNREHAFMNFRFMINKLEK